MQAIRPKRRAQSTLSWISSIRAPLCTLVTLSSAFAFAACFSDALVVEPTNAVVDPADSPVAASIRLNSSYSQITVLGSTLRYHTWVYDSSGAVLCKAHYLGCAPRLFTKHIEWKTGTPGALALVTHDGNILNGTAYVTVLAPGRFEVTASVDGVEASAVVEVVERARAAWSVPTMGASRGIAIGYDGTIYMAGGAGLQAIGPQGEVRWAVPAKAKAIPAIAEDGTLYLGASEGLMSIDSGGTVLWVTRMRGPGAIWSPPAIGSDGTIYQNTNRGSLHAIDPTGRIKWHCEAPGPLFRNPSPPAIAADGTIYFPSEDGHLYALDPDGSVRWRFQTAGPVRAASIGLDGTIYFANDCVCIWNDGHVVLADSRLYALNPDGTERWSVALEGEVWAAPAIGFDGTIYMGTYNHGGATYLFTPDGSPLRKVPSRAIHTPIVAGDGSIYYSNGNVAAFDGDGMPRWSFQPRNFAGPTPAIGFDGRIYAEANDRPDGPYILRAFEELGTNNGGYQGAPWPQERGDRANTGRALRRP
jgi:outer membrane protein assembly factor BamB